MVFGQDVLSPPAALPQAGGDLLLPVPQSRQPAGFTGRHSAFRRSPRQANLTVPRLCLKRWSRAKSNRAWCRRKSPGTLEMGTSLCTHCPDSAFMAGRERGETCYGGSIHPREAVPHQRPATTLLCRWCLPGEDLKMFYKDLLPYSLSSQIRAPVPLA